MKFAEALDQMGDLKGLVLDLRQESWRPVEAKGLASPDKFLKKGQLIVSHHGGRLLKSATWHRAATGAKIIHWWVAGKSRYGISGRDCCGSDSGS